MPTTVTHGYVPKSRHLWAPPDGTQIRGGAWGTRRRGKIKWKVRGQRRVQNPVPPLTICTLQHLHCRLKWLTVTKKWEKEARR